ncbi:MAG: hypothetical protein KME42_04100 [Tildeniella nuda ZEHNDER 1965/U140]|nr:hypothetical protein [Tildeniella nuda ZEHNDER 1965/U140]
MPQSPDSTCKLQYTVQRNGDRWFSGQRKAVSGQRSAVSGQRKADS